MSDVAAPAPAPMRSAPLGQRILRSEGVRFVLPLVIAIVAISLYTNHQNSRFITFDNFQSIFLQVAVLGIIAIGQTFLIVAGQLDLSVGALAALAGVIGATRIKDGGSEMWAVILVLVICALVGLTWGLLVAGLRIPPFILTLGGLSLFTSLALRISKSVPTPAREHFDWLGRHKVLGLTTPVWFFLLITAVAALVMRYTRFGRHVYATGSAEEAAYLAGIPTARTKVLCFVISSTLAGFAGLIDAQGAGQPPTQPGHRDHTDRSSAGRPTGRDLLGRLNTRGDTSMINPDERPPVGRRRFLQGIAAIGGVAAVSGFLQACGSDS